MRCHIPLVFSVLVIGGIRARAAVLRRDSAGQGTPLLLGPPGATSVPIPLTTLSATIDESDADITGGITSPVTLSTPATTTSSSSTSMSTSSSDSQPTSTTSASATSTPTSSSDMHSVPPRQPSSVRYLVPVFLLILITLAVYFVNKYRNRRARSRTQSSQSTRRNDPFEGEGNLAGGWKEIKDEEEDVAWDPRDDPNDELRWKSMEINQPNPYLAVSNSNQGQGIGIGMPVGNSRKSLGVISTASKSWGWRDTFDNWRSARGRNLHDHTDDDRHDHDYDHRREPTVKLVTPTLATYQTLPQLEHEAVPNTRSKSDTLHNVNIGQGQADEKERGSIRALRDKLTSLSYMTSPPSKASGLGLGRKSRVNNTTSSTKRLAPSLANANTNIKKEANEFTAIPAPPPPEWIRPRALSPTQILSPPLHPHLFFHPNEHQQQYHAGEGAVGRERQMLTSNTDDGHSCSEYEGEGTDYGESLVNTPVIQIEEDQKRKENVKFPRIPSTASALANTFDSHQSLTSSPSPSSTENGTAKKKDHTLRHKTASSLVNPLKRTPTGNTTATTNASGNGSRLKPPPSPGVSRRSFSKSTNSSASKSVIRRSTATKDLSSPSPRTPSRRVAAKAEGSSGLPPKSPSPMVTPIKDKVSREKKEQRARDKVEDILKASWSDRALSPPLPPSQSQSQSHNIMIAGAGAIAGAGWKVMPRPGNMSPGVDEMGGGIEQRLAMLKKMEV